MSFERVRSLSGRRTLQRDIHAIAGRAYGRHIGILAATLMAFWPGEIAYTGLVLPEMPFGALFTGCLYAFIVWNDRGKTGWKPHWLVLGVLLGLASLVKGIALFFPTVFFAIWLRSHGLGWETWIRTSLTAAGVLLVLVPWTIRNQVQMGYPLLISSDGAYAMLNARSPVATGTATAQVNEFRQKEFRERLGSPHREALMARDALRYMLTHPREEMRQSPLRLYYLYENDRFGFSLTRKRNIEPLRKPEAGGPKPRHVVHSFLRWLTDAYFFAVLLLALLRCVRAFAPSTGSAFAVHLAFLYFNLLFGVVFHGEVKYHAPLLPFLALLAAVAVDGRQRPWRLGSAAMGRS